MANTLLSIDETVLNELAELMAEDFLPLLKTYLATGDQSIIDLYQAVNDKDKEQVRQCAHSLKGASGNIGAEALNELCQQVEDLAQQNKLDLLPPYIEQLDQKYQRVRKYLVKLIEAGEVADF
jgi:HPt (histidine-containing phosphotransfer) domain-containing protein